MNYYKILLHKIIIHAMALSFTVRKREKREKGGKKEEM